MEDLAIYVIVAAAALFMLRWLVSNFSIKAENKASCGGCPSCEAEDSSTASASSAGKTAHE